MKIKLKTIISLCLVVLFILSLFIYRDYQLFYIGKSCFKYNRSLPNHIYPKYRPGFDGGPSLNDKDGMPILGYYTTIENDDKYYKVEKLVKYAITTNNNIIALVYTIDNDSLYVEVVKDNQKSILCEICFQLKIVSNELVNRSNLKWYEFE